MNDVTNYSFSRKISIATNLSCNLKCIYCYEAERYTKTFDLAKTKNRIRYYLNRPTEKGTVIDLHGGEPFLVFNKIKELCEWLWNSNFPERYVVHTTTNGTLVHADIQEWLFQHKEKFHVKLSLDGCKIAHNINRCNSFDLIDYAFFAKCWPHEYVKMTISPLTIQYLSQSIIFFHSVPFLKIQANFAELVDWNDTDLVDSFKKEMKLLSEYYTLNNTPERCTLFYNNYSNVLAEKQNYLDKLCTNGCKVAFDIQGDKSYPCQLVLPSVCGQSVADSFVRKVETGNSTVSGKCTSCAFLPLCSTCYGANYIERGTISKRDPNQCCFNKLRIKEVCLFDYNRIINLQSSEITKEDKIAMKAIHLLLPSLELVE